MSQQSSNDSWPELGCGVGLRNEHYNEILSHWPKVDWFEAISENFMNTGGRPLQILKKVREKYPVVLHGTSLSIASVDPLDPEYLKRLKALYEIIEPAMVSDHLCWSGVGGEKLHDLLPVPYTEEMLRHVVDRVSELQDFLGRRFMLENVSTYLTYAHSYIPEWEFLAEVSRASGCGILLDLNNIYVNSFNHEFDPMVYLDSIPPEAIGQFHLAGHTDKKDFLFDTHSGEVIDPVWNLYKEALKRWGKIPTLIEWDEEIPELSRLLEEVQKAKGFYQKAESRKAIKVEKRQKTFEVKEGPSLESVQQWFREKIQPLERENSQQEITLNLQRGTPGTQRLAVYSDGYIARIHAALEEVYPAVKTILGEGGFKKLAEAYAKTFPSKDYNLSLAGRNLAEFFKTYKPELPFLKDLAFFEWEISRSFHAYDGALLNVEELAKLSAEDWAGIRFSLQPSCAVLKSSWPIFDLWEARHTPREEIDLQIEGRPQNVLIYRQGTEVFCELLEEEQFQILQGIAKQRLVAEILSELVEMGKTPPVQTWFQDWAAKGLFSGFQINARTSL